MTALSQLTILIQYTSVRRDRRSIGTCNIRIALYSRVDEISFFYFAILILIKNCETVPLQSNYVYTVPKVIDFPRYYMKCSAENVILREIFHVVSGFPLHFMLYPGNLDCFSNSARSKAGRAISKKMVTIEQKIVLATYQSKYVEGPAVLFFLSCIAIRYSLPHLIAR